MSKRKQKGRLFVTQANGRERGIEGVGMGHITEWNGGIARGTATPNKRERQNRRDRRDRQKGWD